MSGQGEAEVLQLLLSLQSIHQVIFKSFLFLFVCKSLYRPQPIYDVLCFVFPKQISFSIWILFSISSTKCPILAMCGE